MAADDSGFFSLLLLAASFPIGEAAETASLDVVSVFLRRELPMLIFLLSEVAFRFRVEGFAAVEAIAADALVVLTDDVVAAFLDPVFAAVAVAVSFSVPVASLS
jgi:hypothetical protein